MPNAPQLKVLFEDNHVLAVAKPAGLPTMGAAAGEPSLIKQAKRYIKERYSKPGNVYLGVVSRLDEPVSGVVVFARTSKSAARLSEQFRSRAVEKVYWAVVEGNVGPSTGEWVDWMAKDERQRRMIIANEGTPEAQEARLVYAVLRRVGGDSFVEVRPVTGRKHQIRLQFAAHGAPIVGDSKYGSRQRLAAGIALHARSLAFDHPISKQRIVLETAPPAYWKRWLPSA